MPFNPKLTHVAIAACIAACVGPTLADPVFITGLDTSPDRMVSSTSDPAIQRGIFEGKLVDDISKKTEGFTTVPLGSYPDSNNNNRTLRLDSLGAMVTSEPEPPQNTPPWPGEVVDRTTDSPANGRFDTTGTPDEKGRWWLAAATFIIDFDAPIEAFGFYVTDPGDFRGQLGMRLRRQDGTPTELFDLDALLLANHSVYGVEAEQMPNDDVNNGWLQFFGFYDDTCAANCYTQVEFVIGQVDPNNTNVWDYLGFDDWISGRVAPANDVPEPGSLALVGASLLALAATRRRRRQA